MGHKDPSILHNHYKALVLKSEAEKYWNLRSELVVGSHVIVYCLAGTTGWGSTFEGRPTVLWKPLSKPLVQSYTYTTNNGAITITKYTGFGGAVTSSILRSGILKVMELKRI